VWVFTQSDMPWQPWRPRRCWVLACASSSHGPLEGGECLIEPPPGTSEFGQSKPSGCTVESTWRQACRWSAFRQLGRACQPYHQLNKSWGWSPDAVQDRLPHTYPSSYVLRFPKLSLTRDSRNFWHQCRRPERQRLLCVCVCVCVYVCVCVCVNEIPTLIIYVCMLSDVSMYTYLYLRTRIYSTCVRYLTNLLLNRQLMDGINGRH
jgi:hypothetical protein